VRGGDQAHARAALDPHLAIGVEPCAPRAASASPKEGVDDVELEGEDVVEDVRARRGRVERVEDVRRFCRGLVEEAQAGEGGEAQGPELCEEGRRLEMRGCVRRKEMGCVRSRRGSRPLGSPARCGRVPSARVRANCSSSDGRKKKA
jgi:hypothetical protein